MEPKERLVEDSNINSCVKTFAEAYQISKSIYDQSREIERFKKSRKLLKKESIHDRFISCKNDISIANMEIANKKLSNRLKTLDKTIITNTLDKLKKAVEHEIHYDISSNEKELEKLAEMIDSFKVDMKNKLDIIDNTKLDKENNIQSKIKEVDKSLRSLLSDKLISTKIEQDTETLEELLRNNTPPTPEELCNIALDETFHKLFGTHSERELRKECDLEAATKQSMIDELGRRFMAQILRIKSRQSTNIYPMNAQEKDLQSLQVRDSGTMKVKKPESSKLKKSLTKMSKMKNECDELLLLLDSTLNSRPVKTLFDNISYIDRVTKNHKEVLETINNPWKDLHNNDPPDEEDMVISIDDDDAVKSAPPPQIELYRNNNQLSAIMAASLTEYTKQLYFSDLTQRVENLEKKLQ